MSVHITYEMVQNDLPNIIDRRGWNFKYKVHPGSDSTCTYVWDGEPDCLIGCYLVDLGLPTEAFESLEGLGIDSIFINGHLETYGFTADSEALHAMENVQSLQDNDVPWGDAYNIVFE